MAVTLSSKNCCLRCYTQSSVVICRLMPCFFHFFQLLPCAGSGDVRIDPLHFLAGCCKRRLNQALSVLSVSIGFCVCMLLFIRDTFVLTLVCVCMRSVSRLFWLSCQYLPSYRLERLV